VDVRPVGDAQQEITVTTLVRTHNRLGRIYLALVLPFHRVIVPAMLAQAGRDCRTRRSSFASGQSGSCSRVFPETRATSRRNTGQL
jgi:hypothetical protein